MAFAALVLSMVATTVWNATKAESKKVSCMLCCCECVCQNDVKKCGTG